MYYALERYASRDYCCDCDLNEAYHAAAYENPKAFKKIRAKIIARVEKNMNEAKDRLYEYDP